MATRGPKPTPTEIQKLRGNPGKRKLPPEVVFDDEAMPACPDWLDDVAKAEWANVCKSLFDAGVLKRVDAAALAAYCQSYARWAEAEQRVQESGQVIYSDKGNGYMSPWLTAAQAAQKQMVELAAQFGMTPSGRARVKVPPKKKKKTLADVLFGAANAKAK